MRNTASIVKEIVKGFEELGVKTTIYLEKGYNAHENKFTSFCILEPEESNKEMEKFLMVYFEGMEGVTINRGKVAGIYHTIFSSDLYELYIEVCPSKNFFQSEFFFKGFIETLD